MASFLLTSPAWAQDNQDLRFFRIGAGPTSETLYALGTAISASISRPPGSLPCDTLGGVCGVPGLIAVAQSKSGSIENLNEIRNGEVDSALVRADIADQAFKGSGPFFHQGSNENLRVIANVFPVKAHIIVKASSEIYHVEDLARKTVSLGAKGSGTHSFARAVLQAYGYDIYNIRYDYLRPGPAVDALQNGSIDAAVIIGAAPIPALEELSEVTDIRLIPIEGEARKKLKTIYANLDDAAINGNLYGEDKIIDTVSTDVLWITNATADINLIQNITQAFWQSETEAFFLRNNPEHSFPKKEEAIPHGLIPLHPGAIKYYQSAGLM